jgi:hypothetical protein
MRGCRTCFEIVAKPEWRNGGGGCDTVILLFITVHQSLPENFLKNGGPPLL